MAVLGAATRGADTATVSLALLIAGVISTVAFAVIVAVGAVVSGNPAASVLGLLTSLGSAAAAALTVVSLHGRATHAACLAAAITAIGVAVPWDKLLVWSAGADAASFSYPVRPGRR